MLRYLIIGAGVAGIAAAESIRRVHPGGEVTVICEEAEGYYSRPGLAYYLTHEIPENLLFPRQKPDFERLGIALLHAHAEAILPEVHQVQLDGGGRLPYDRLLIATGSQASPLNVPGSEAEGVVKLDHLSDARTILKLARRGRRAVVVGGGITALEIVEGLRLNGVRTHYFLRGSRYWGNVLDESESRIIEGRLEEEGVRLHFNTRLGEILTRKGKLYAVRTQDGQRVDCDLLAYAIGVQPRFDLARLAGLRTDAGILVDEYLQTSAADVFAAGDVAQIYDPLSGTTVLDTLWGLARQQGEIAGHNMASSREEMQPYRRAVAFNVTRLAGLTTTIIGAVGSGRDEDLLGIARGDSQVWRLRTDATAIHTASHVNRVRLLLGERTLAGAVVMGDQALSRPLLHLIGAQVDISPIYQRLIQPDAPIAEIIQSYWTESQGNGRQA